MKRILKRRSSVVLLFAIALMLSSCGKKNRFAELKDGLYFMTDSTAGVKVAPFKTFDYVVNESVDTACLLSLENSALSMEYDSAMYVDTFAVIRVKLSAKEEATWKQKTAGAQQEKVALVLNSKFIQWMVIPDKYVTPVFTLCYCDYSKAELKQVEALTKENPAAATR